MHSRNFKTSIVAFCILAIIVLCFISAIIIPNLRKAPSVPTSVKNPDLSTHAKITMAGDVLIHSPIMRRAKTRNGYDFTNFFTQMKPEINGDLNICNLEGPVNGSKAPSSYPLFNYPPAIIDGVKYLGFNLAITANNHAFDQGWAGVKATIDNLNNKNLDHIGTYKTQKAYDNECYIKDLNGIKVGVVAYSALDNGMNVGRKYAMRKFNQDKISDCDKIIKDVNKLRANGAEVVIVCLHWGVEYQDNPYSGQVAYANKLADAGVDIIMGGHPHCVQPMETITSAATGKECYVYYSLGNFFADQIALNKSKTQYGMLGILELNRDRNGKLNIKPSYKATTTVRVGNTYILKLAEKGSNAYNHVAKVNGVK